MANDLRYRQIHLDFHTSELIPGIGADWDADAFGDMMKDAHVDSVTCFAKCHHGLLYYDTDRPERHPHLPKNLDLLGEQIEALHKRDIKAPIYITVLWDEYAGVNHPEWLALDIEGRPQHRKPLSKQGWHVMDMASPYADFLADQIDDVLRAFKPVDGIFLDICFDMDSYSVYRKKAMTKAGVNIDDPKQVKAFSHQLSLDYMARYRKQIEQAHGGKKLPIAFNSRPLSNLAEEHPYLRHVEIEALATGGWGYMFFPIHVRYARQFGMPYMGMTARFHKSWADFGGLKPQAALNYETEQMIAHGARCSIGDQIHPRGYLDKASYDRIGTAYGHVEACEPWLKDATVLADIGVMFPAHDAVSHEKPQEEKILAAEGYHPQPGGTREGVVRALQALQCQFDFVPMDAKAKLINSYDLIIVPESCELDKKLIKTLNTYRDKGGKVLIVHDASFDEKGKPVFSGSKVKSHGNSEFLTTYLRLAKSVAGELPKTDHVIYERPLDLTAGKGAKSLGKVVVPYFDRNWRHYSSHFQTPPEKASKYAVGFEEKNLITLAYPVFMTYATHSSESCRQLIAGCIDRLLPERLLHFDNAPTHLESTIQQQKKRTIVHLLSYRPIRRTPKLDLVEDATPILDLSFLVKLKKKPSKVYLAPSSDELDFTWKKGYAQVTIPVCEGHEMVVFE